MYKFHNKKFPARSFLGIAIKMIQVRFVGTGKVPNISIVIHKQGCKASVLS